jgi:hypothetical protein
MKPIGASFPDAEVQVDFRGGEQAHTNHLYSPDAGPARLSIFCQRPSEMIPQSVSRRVRRGRFFRTTDMDLQRPRTYVSVMKNATKIRGEEGSQRGHRGHRGRRRKEATLGLTGDRDPEVRPRDLASSPDRCNACSRRLARARVLPPASSARSLGVSRDDKVWAPGVHFRFCGLSLCPLCPPWLPSLT